MTEAAFDKQVKVLGDQLKERINLAISIAVDEDKEFIQAEEVFQESITVLTYYNCIEAVVDQLINFSKVAYFRELFVKALYYADDAVRKSNTDELKKKAAENLHSMAFRMFELYVVEPEKMQKKLDIADIEEYLEPQDYCLALENAYKANKHIKTEDDKNFVSSVLKRISLEVMRQGLKYERNEEIDSALLLLKAVIPYLNEKRANIINDEIRKMEAR